MAIRRGPNVGRQCGFTGDKTAMGLYTQNGRQYAAYVDERYRGLRPQLHQPQRSDEERLEHGQNR